MMKCWKLCQEAKGVFTFWLSPDRSRMAWRQGNALIPWALPSRNGHGQAGHRMSVFRGFLSCRNNLQTKRLANCKPVMAHFWLADRKEDSWCDCSHIDFHNWQNGGGLFFFFFPLQNTRNNDNGHQGPDFAKVPSFQ